MMASLPVQASLLAASGLAEVVARAYGLHEVRCQLIASSLRDVYLVDAREGRRVLAVYRAGWRTRSQVVAEWRLVAHLASHRVPVAPAVATRGGELVIDLPAPEGLRYAVLMLYVPGEHLRRRSGVPAAAAYGRAIASVHTLADQLEERIDRPPVDLSLLVRQAVTALRATMPERQDQLMELQRYADDMLVRLERLPRPVSPAYGLIHGDVIRANAQVRDDGAVTVLDFDMCGGGWRAYDVASFCFAVRGSPEEDRFRQAFLDGYTSVRPMGSDEWALLPLFEAVRAMFDLGIPALELPVWGRAVLEERFEPAIDALRRRMMELTTKQ